MELYFHFLRFNRFLEVYFHFCPFTLSLEVCFHFNPIKKALNRDPIPLISGFAAIKRLNMLQCAYD